MITESRAWEARPHRRPPPRRNSAGFSRMIQLTARRSTKARIARLPMPHLDRPNAALYADVRDGKLDKSRSPAFERGATARC